MDAFLGIDTSCYTTSVCVVNGQGHILADERIILSVPAGGRGLSQSNMVFQHTRNLPELAERAVSALPSGTHIRAVAVTDRPRRRDDSYMPAFLAGLGCARSLAAFLDVPLYAVSHQENHLMAILRIQPELAARPFWGLHVSGGTTDLLYACPDEEGLAIQRLGGTSDISAGQFIDRVGVALKLPFPAGVHLDKIGQPYDRALKGNRVFCRNGEISFSGPESQFQRELAAGGQDAASVAQRVLMTVWEGLRELLDYARESGMNRLGAAGGVLSNQWLRQQLREYGRRRRIDVVLAPDGYSADNASGAAFWACYQTKRRGGQVL